MNLASFLSFVVYDNQAVDSQPRQRGSFQGQSPQLADLRPSVPVLEHRVRPRQSPPKFDVRNRGPYGWRRVNITFLLLHDATKVSGVIWHSNCQSRSAQ